MDIAGHKIIHNKYTAEMQKSQDRQKFTIVFQVFWLS